MDRKELIAKTMNEFYKSNTDDTWIRYRKDDSWKQFIPIAEAIDIALQSLK